MSNRTQAERIAALEVQVTLLTTEVTEVNRKLDDLLAIKNRGIGAFWLASTLVGASLFGFVNVLLGWMKG